MAAAVGAARFVARATVSQPSHHAVYLYEYYDYDDA